MWLLGNASNIDSAHASVSASELRELEEASRQAAAEYIYGQFPALSLELDQSRVYETEIKLHYKARIWSHEEDAPRSWDSYMYAHVYYSGDRYSSTRYNNYYHPQGTCNELPSQRCGAAAATYQVNMELQVQGIISAVSNALIRTAIGKDVSLQVRMVPMPPVNFNLQSEQNEVARRGRNNGSLMLWIIMFPLITMLLIPSLCSMIASEKESGLLETIKLEGGRIQSYFIGTAGFCFSYSVAFSTTFIIMLVGSGATGSGSEVYVPAGSAVALIISGSVAQAGYVLFVGLCGYVFISKSRNAALLGIMMVLMSVMVSWFMVVSYGQTEAFEGHNALEAGLISGAPWVLLFLSPPLAYSQACSMMLWYNGAQDFWRCIAWLWIDGIVYSAAAVAYTQTQKGALKGFLRSPWNKTSGESDSDLDVVSTGGGVSTLFQGDDDVEKERTRVVAGNSSEVAAAAIVMRNLVKSYESVSHGRRVSKRAVNELCLAVQTNEIFGLLGPNGAGKTTTISMLTGLERPSGGSATIGGFDVETQIRLVHKKIGVCPQFDHLWPEMSVRQHLIFFALLKGTPRKETELAARQLAEDVHLDGDVYNKVASKLSGGEKRRLSIAIALTGSPPVTFFDEPTTGLDPAVRRNIWSIIKAQQAEGRCIVITTHSMEEADSLCDRIGIMAGGGLRCLGTQTHLKTKFGDGFKVVMTADSVSRSAEIEALMLSLSPGAKLAYNTGKQFTYTVPLASGDVAQVFNTMETSRRAHGIVDWGITQASLEEVFIKVVTAWEDESLNVTRLAERHRPSLVGDQL
jgi:ABC-type multidrug transport system ATPase subunit